MWEILEQNSGVGPNKEGRPRRAAMGVSTLQKSRKAENIRRGVVLKIFVNGCIVDTGTEITKEILALVLTSES